MQCIWLSGYNVQNMVTSKAKNKKKTKKKKKKLYVSGYMEFQNREELVGIFFYLFVNCYFFFFCLVQNFNMGIIGKQCVLLGKYHGIP